MARLCQNNFESGERLQGHWSLLLIFLYEQNNMFKIMIIKNNISDCQNPAHDDPGWVCIFVGRQIEGFIKT